MQIISIPCFYQAEVIFPKCRKSKLLCVLSSCLVEIQETTDLKELLSWGNDNISGEKHGAIYLEDNQSYVKLRNNDDTGYVTPSYLLSELSRIEDVINSQPIGKTCYNEDMKYIYMPPEIRNTSPEVLTEDMMTACHVISSNENYVHTEIQKKYNGYRLDNNEFCYNDLTAAINPFGYNERPLSQSHLHETFVAYVGPEHNEVNQMLYPMILTPYLMMASLHKYNHPNIVLSSDFDPDSHINKDTIIDVLNINLNNMIRKIKGIHFSNRDSAYKIPNIRDIQNLDNTIKRDEVKLEELYLALQDITLSTEVESVKTDIYEHVITGKDTARYRKFETIYANISMFIDNYCFPNTF